MAATVRRAQDVGAVGSRTVWVAFFLLLLALVLPACGGGSSGGGGSERGRIDGGDAGSGSSGGARVVEGSGAQPGEPMPSSGTPGGEYAMSETNQDTGGALASSAGQSTGQALPEEFDRKIVKTAELGVEAESVRESAAEAQRIVSRFDGSVLSSELRGDDESVSADLVLSVPSQEFEAALDELRGLGKEVTTDTVRGEDVTEEFVDLESRERNLLAAEESLLRLYDRAESVEDTLTVQRELTGVRGQIEQVQGRLQYLENRTSTSQISLSIQPVPAPPPPKPPAWSPAKAATEAWGASLAVLQAAATAVISAVVFGWWLVPVIVAGLVWWRRRNRVSGPATTDSGP